jgi:hypothetical protein
MWKPEGERPLGRPRHRWENNIQINRKAIDWECVDCISVAKVRDEWLVPVNMVVNLQVL